MDQLVDEFRDLLKRLQKVDPKLHAELVRVIRRIEHEFVRRYGVPDFAGWIDAWQKPKP